MPRGAKRSIANNSPAYFYTITVHNYTSEVFVRDLSKAVKDEIFVTQILFSDSMLEVATASRIIDPIGGAGRVNGEGFPR